MHRITHMLLDLKPVSLEPRFCGDSNELENYARPLGAGLLLAGCATPPEKIEAAYVSPITYEAYTCEQIAEEAARVSDRAAQTMGIQKKKAQGDAVKVGVALVLFWPAAFLVDGNGANEHEVARLLGEMDTLEKVSIQKNCGIEFQRPEPPKIKNEAADLTSKNS